MHRTDCEARDQIFDICLPRPLAYSLAWLQPWALPLIHGRSKCHEEKKRFHALGLGDKESSKLEIPRKVLIRLQCRHLLACCHILPLPTAAGRRFGYGNITGATALNRAVNVFFLRVWALTNCCTYVSLNLSSIHAQCKLGTYKGEAQGTGPVTNCLVSFPQQWSWTVW